MTAAATGATGDTSATGATGELQPGGTVELAMLGDVSAAFDPQKEYYSVTWECYRCCLLRTLLSYNGRTTAEGGAELQPDIASALPEVSSDGLTYTFTLKSGINYGDPFGDVEVTSGDIVRALERDADPNASVGGYNFYYSIIDGFSDFGEGKADSIAGLETPDDSTLVVTLTEPAGYLPYLFAMAASAPIPPDGEDEPLGAAEGHTKDYGRFMVSTGPYQFLGAENLDFSLPADEQTPVAGYEPGKSIQCWSATRTTIRRRTGCVPPIRTRSTSRSAGTTTTCTTRSRPASWTGSWTASCLHRCCAVLDGPDAAAAAAHQPVGRRSVHLVQHGDPAVRRRARPQGDQPRVSTRRACARSVAVSPSARSRVTSW